MEPAEAQGMLPRKRASNPFGACRIRNLAVAVLACRFTACVPMNVICASMPEVAVPGVTLNIDEQPAPAGTLQPGPGSQWDDQPGMLSSATKSICPMNPYIDEAVTLKLASVPGVVVNDAGRTDRLKSCTVKGGQLTVMEFAPFVILTFSLKTPPIVGEKPTEQLDPGSVSKAPGGCEPKFQSQVVPSAGSGLA